MEIISGIAFSLFKFCITLLFIRTYQKSELQWINKFLLFIGLKNFVILLAAVIVPNYLGLDKHLFVVSFMISYFALLIPELVIIKKTIYKKEKLNQGMIDEQR